MASEQNPVSSVTDLAIQALRDSVEQQRSSSVFACGGKIPVLAPEDYEALPRDAAVASLPVDLRWDPLERTVPPTAGAQGGKSEADVVSSKQTKLVLPLEPETRGNLDRLLADTQPATFGRGGEDVYDEAYRKAAKMDPARFSTSFSPYVLGIIDEIAQALLPSAIDSRHARAVRAELYKLNIYSGPSGKFKAHVDTPRAVDQFGSLVVCLPLAHEGGALEVRHKGTTAVFDWGREGQAEGGGGGDRYLRWAAFYSDCEHEVLEVTSGHRITLTYNLYAARGNGLLAGHCPTLDPARLPLYRKLADVLADQQFMADGGCLGFYCQHAYPHTSETSCLPDTLKGVDMMLWEASRALGLRAHLRPVLQDEDAEYHSLYTENDEEQEAPAQHVGASFKFDWSRCLEVEGSEQFHEMMEEVRTPRDKTERVFQDGDVVWATDPKHQEPQYIYMTYGNEPSICVMYSNCAIIAEIPPWAERKQTVDVQLSRTL